MYFRLELNLGVLFQRALVDLHAVLSYLSTCRRLRHRFKQQVLHGFIRSFHLLQWTLGSKLFWQWKNLKLDFTEWQASFWFIHLSKSYFIGLKAGWSWSPDYPGKEMKWPLTLKYVSDQNVIREIVKLVFLSGCFIGKCDANLCLDLFKNASYTHIHTSSMMSMFWIFWIKIHLSFLVSLKIKVIEYNGCQIK